MTVDFETFTADLDIQERLRQACDFDVGLGYGVPSWCSVDGGEHLEVVARDSTGGEFIMMTPSRRVLFVSSEGDAGVIAADRDELIALVAACPYWRDLLSLSGAGSLVEMRRAAPVLELSWLDEDEEFAEIHEFLKSRLGLADADDPIGRLHRAVSASDVVVRAPDGNPAVPLFKRRS
jgi:hypothetical protein